MLEQVRCRNPGSICEAQVLVITRKILQNNLQYTKKYDKTGKYTKKHNINNIVSYK